MRRWTPAIVFLVALAVRLGITLELQRTAIFRTPELDSIEYLTWAQHIAAGDFTWPEAPPHGPGYPMFLGLLLAIGRGSILAVHVMQAIVGAATAVVIALIARRVYGDGAGLAAGLLAALYAPLALIDVSIYAEGLFVFLLACSLLAVMAIESRPALMTFLAGTALGVAITVRPTAAILIPIYAWQVWRHARRAIAVLAIAVLYPVLPVLAHNWAATGDLVLVQSGGGLNFYIGNARGHDGTAWARPGGTWDLLRGEAWRAGVRGATNEDRYYVRRALSEMRAGLFAKKFVWLLQNEEIRDSHSFYFFRQRAPLLYLLPFGVVFAIALAGVIVRRREPATWLLVAYAVAMSITVVALVVGSRYRIPIMVPLFVLAGGCVAPVDWRAIAAGVLAGILTLVWIHAPSHDLAEEWAMEGIALGKEGRGVEARAAFDTAIRMNPKLAIAWTGIGDLHMRDGDLRGAESFYRRSLASDPNHALTYNHLALERAAIGDRGAAISLLERALSIRADRGAMYTLAGFLFASGQRAAAKQWLDQLLEVYPDDVEAATALKRVEASFRQ